MPSREDLFVYLAYIDDSETQRRGSNFVVLAGVLISDLILSKLETVIGASIQYLLPPEKWEDFVEFKASDLFGCHGAFEGVEEFRRHGVIKILLNQLSALKIPVFYGAVSKKEWDAKYFSHGSASKEDICFRNCLQGVKAWVNTPKLLSGFEVNSYTERSTLVVMDDCEDKGKRNQSRKSFREFRVQLRPHKVDLQNPDFSNVAWHLHDDMYFGSSRDSIGLQLADLCAYFISRHLQKWDDSEHFYKQIEPHILFSKIEPEGVESSNDVSNQEGKTTQ